MKRLMAIALVVAAFMAVPGDPACASVLNTQGARALPPVDRDYLLALNTADEFLHAWLRRDWTEGPKYLSAGLRERVGAQTIKSFFSGLSNPHHQAYEVVGAERVSPSVIRFQVWLYEYYTDTNPPPERRPAPLILDLQRVNGWAWLVKEFPREP